MNIEEIRNYCLRKTAVSESFPFDTETLVFKVGSKMFLLMGLNHDPIRINVKCEPHKAIELRQKYTSVVPGYHMNNKHWNTLLLNGNLSPKFIKEQIDHSYEMVVKTMSKKEKKDIGL